MNWTLFASTFALIFIAELPDKTALAALIMAARKPPLPIFLGACAAFVIQSLIAVFLGSLITFLPETWVKIPSALMFFILASLAVRRSMRPDEEADLGSKPAHSFFQTLVMAFAVIFMAEWGDLTQIATATLVARYHDAITVFVSATLALWCVTALAVIVGHQIKHRIGTKLLNRIAAFVLALVGALLLADQLRTMSQR